MKKKRKIKNKVLMIAVLCLSLIITGYFLVNAYIDGTLNKLVRKNQINENDANIADEIAEQNQDVDTVNIVLFGTDNDGDYSDEQRSDAIKIISLDFNEKEIKITSLERDLVVWIPGDHKNFGHLNWAFWFGGAELAVKTLNYNFDMDITKFVTVNFESIEKIVDLVGGVDITLTSAEVENLEFETNSTGIYHLTGAEALTYSRIRKMDDDYHRMARQQNVIQALVDKATEMSKVELLEFINNCLPYVTTNLSNSDIKKYALELMNFDLDIKTFQVPVDGYTDTCPCERLGGYLLSSYEDMSQQMHDFIYGKDFYTPSQNLLDNQKNIYDTYGSCEQ